MGLFLTYKSNNDSVVLNADAYINWFKKVLGIRSRRHLFRKEVIINDPDYARLPEDLRRLTSECRAYAERNRLKSAPNYFKLWMGRKDRDEAMEGLNERMETLIDEMSNTRSLSLLSVVNNYPVLSVHAPRTSVPQLLVMRGVRGVVPGGAVFLFPHLGIPVAPEQRH